MSDYTANLFIAGSALVAVIAFCWSLWEKRLDLRMEREARADTCWQSYLTLAFDNPKFAAGKVDSLFTWSEERERYEWFVGKMLYACESVLNYAQDDRDWHDAIKVNVATHKELARVRPEQFDDGWSPCLRKLIKEALADA
ncbi:MAG: hypothetical protein U0995_02705 [Erythrobacter sp.]|nr:hypothetical protein [Erythrobacter sp.]